jgi:hypothetical protein
MESQLVTRHRRFEASSVIPEDINLQKVIYARTLFISRTKYFRRCKFQ